MSSSMYQPSPYYPLSAAYHPIQPLSPRDKYLAAVAEAEAARASYLADEAARREEETLQQRLAELRARRQRFSAPGPVNPRDRRLYELRREVEEEEHRQGELALAAEAERREQERVRVRWEIEEQARREERRRQIVGGSRSFGYPGFRSAHSRQSPFHPQSHPHHQPVARQGPPTVLEVVIGEPYEPYEAPNADVQPSIKVDIRELLGQLTGLGNAQAQEASQRPVQSSICARPSACAPPSALAKARAEAWKSAAAARGAHPSTNKACPALNKTCHSASQPCHPSSNPSGSTTNPVAPTAPQLDPTVIADLAGQFLGTKVDPTQVKSAMDMFSAFVPQAQATQASASATQASAQPAQAPAQARAAPSLGQATEFGGLEGLLSTLFSGAQAASKLQPSSSSSAQASTSKAPTAAASSSAAGSSAQPAQSSSTTAPIASPFDPLAPLRAQLATRLNTEEEAEIRDTMHAIMLSLQDQEEKFKDGSAGSSGSGSVAPGLGSKVNTNTKGDVEKANANKPDITVDTAQAKGKGRASPEHPRTPTSQDIAASLDTVRNIDAAFAALAGDFAWPSGLDFTPASSREASPARSSGDGTSEDDGASTTSSTSSPLSKLAYTARNQPVRFYEQSLSALLAQLDAVESWGSEEVRRVRREGVGRVGRALEEVEGEVEGRWGVWVRKETARGRTQVPATEEKVAVESDATKVDTDAVALEAEVKETEAKTNVEGEEAVDPESQAPSVAESVLTVRPASPNPVTQDSEEPAAPIATNEDTSSTVDTAATPIEALTASDETPATSNATSTTTHAEGYEVESTDDTAEDASSPADLEHAAAPSDAPISDVNEPSSPSSMSSPSVDTFLLPAEPEQAPAKKVAHAEGTDSDWSEVEA